jgi:hypothetical protein
MAHSVQALKVGAATAAFLLGVGAASAPAATIVDHRHTRLMDIPTTWIQQAKQTLHIAYGHTSHGSQLVTGMEAVFEQYGSLYAFAPYGTGARSMREPLPGDLGNPDRTSWAVAAELPERPSRDQRDHLVVVRPGRHVRPTSTCTSA